MLVASAAEADPQLFVSLDYQLEAEHGSCPSEAAFRAMVSEQLGYDPFRSPSALTVVARARAAATGYRGSVEWYDAGGSPRGERQLTSDGADCAAFVRTMSFAIAVQIQLLAKAAGDATVAAKGAASGDEARSSPGAASAAPSAVRHDTQRRALAPRADGSEPWQILAGAGLFAAFGIAPQATAGGRVFAAARHDWFSSELGAEVTLPASYSTGGTASGFEQHVLVGSAALCLAWREWAACSVSKAGRVYVRGFGVDLPRAPSGTIALTGLRLALHRELGAPWVAAVRLETLASLGAWDVTLNRRTVWTTPAVSLSLGADLAWLF